MNSNSKLRVALFFGGVSSEHEVSCVSASAWLRALGQSPCAEQYEVFPVGITKTGRWLACHPTPEAMADGSWEQGGCTPCVLSPDRADHGIWLLKDGKAELVRIDICAPVMHGKNGEDGTIQGLFEMARIPYVGCGVLGSAVCMDKAVANALMDAAGVPHCKWVAATRADLALNGPVVLDAVEAKLGYPIFVKPANAGSSVGISKAADRAALEKAVEIALREDDKVVFEEFIDAQEVECAAIGNPDDPASVMTPGRDSGRGRVLHLRRQVQKRRVPDRHPRPFERGKARRGEGRGPQGLSGAELRGSVPLRLLCGARHRARFVQRTEHPARLYAHQYVPQADGARGTELCGTGR